MNTSGSHSAIPPPSQMCGQGTAVAAQPGHEGLLLSRRPHCHGKVRGVGCCMFHTAHLILHLSRLAFAINCRKKSPDLSNRWSTWRSCTTHAVSGPFCQNPDGQSISVSFLYKIFVLLTLEEGQRKSSTGRVVVGRKHVLTELTNW